MNKLFWKSSQGSAMMSSFLAIFLTGLSIKHFSDKSIVMRKTVNNYKVDSDLKYLKKKINFEVSCEEIGTALENCDGSPIQLYTSTADGKTRLTSPLASDGAIAGAGKYLGWYVKTICEGNNLKIKAAKYNAKSQTFIEDPLNGKLLDWNNPVLTLFDENETICQQASDDQDQVVADSGSASTFSRLTFKPELTFDNYTIDKLPYKTWGHKAATVTYEASSINAELIIDADLIYGGEDHTSDFLSLTIYSGGTQIHWDNNTHWIDHTDSKIAQHYRYRLTYPTTPGEDVRINFHISRGDWDVDHHGPLTGAEYTDMIISDLTFIIEEYNE